MHPSYYVHNALHDVNSSIHSIGSYEVQKSVVKNLTTEMAQNVFNAYLKYIEELVAKQTKLEEEALEKVKSETVKKVPTPAVKPVEEPKVEQESTAEAPSVATEDDKANVEEPVAPVQKSKKKEKKKKGKKGGKSESVKQPEPEPVSEAIAEPTTAPEPEPVPEVTTEPTTAPEPEPALAPTPEPVSQSDNKEVSEDEELERMLKEAEQEDTEQAVEKPATRIELINEDGYLQMLFDVRFLGDVLLGKPYDRLSVQSISTGVAPLEQDYVKLVELITKRVDPVNWVDLEKGFSEAVLTCVSNNRLLIPLGISKLLQRTQQRNAMSTPTKSEDSQGTQQSIEYSPIKLCDPGQHFSLLPIPGREVKNKAFSPSNMKNLFEEEEKNQEAKVDEPVQNVSIGRKVFGGVTGSLRSFGFW
jgi:hypothetical protein